MRILAVAPYAAYPSVGGGKLRVFHLLNEWMRRGHEVTLWCAPSDEPRLQWRGDHMPSLHELPARGRTSIPSKLASLVSRLPEGVWARPVAPSHVAGAAGRFDIAVIMQALVGRYGEALIDVGVPVVLDQQNVEYEISREVSRLSPGLVHRTRARLDVWKWRRYERRLISTVDLTVAVSDLDARAFRHLAPSARISVHPSGADLRSLRFVDHVENRQDRLIMTGTLGYLPNLDAAHWMIESILPKVRSQRPDARLVLVGASAPPGLGAGRSDVEVAGRVPVVQPYLDGADLFVAPLRGGGGTRLKLLEAFAVGLPVVATTMAATGIAATDGVHLSIADDAEAFADAVVRLLEDRRARRDQARAARQLVEHHYDWATIAAAYEADLESVVETRRR